MSDYTYDPQKIYHELLTNGDDWADKKAAYEVLNDVTKSILASLKDPTISDAKATTEALAHPTYRQHLRSLGEDLEPVPCGAIHDIEHPEDEVQRDPLMKQVAHGVDEDGLRCLPGQRQRQSVLVYRQVEPGRIVRLPHGLEAFGHAFSIAVLAPGADLGAAGDGIPGRFRPFYGRTYTHSQLLQQVSGNSLSDRCALRIPRCEEQLKQR